MGPPLPLNTKYFFKFCMKSFDTSEGNKNYQTKIWEKETEVARCLRSLFHEDWFCMKWLRSWDTTKAFDSFLGPLDKIWNPGIAKDKKRLVRLSELWVGTRNNFIKNMFSDYNWFKPDIKNKKIIFKSPIVWKLMYF